jgi:hypothetical protein
MIGPVEMPTISSPDGFTYRNNVLYPSNQDRVEVIQSQKQLSLLGIHLDNAAVNLAGSQLEGIEDHFWPDVYLMLHEMAQYRDGYKSQDAALDTAARARYRDEMILTIKINIRVLWSLYHCVLYNEGTKTMVPGFAGKRRRMQELLEWSNKLVYPQEWDEVIAYWSTVFVPYPGGPVCYNLFSPKAITNDTSGTFTAFTAINRPDLTLTADVTGLLDDILLGLTEIDRYSGATAAWVNDYKLLTSIYKMMGFPTPQTPVAGLTVSPQHFVDQFMNESFYYTDNKGAGTDTFVCSDDIGGDIEALIDVQADGPVSPLWWKGLLGIYAFDLQDSATSGYAAITEKIAAMGLVRDSEWAVPGNIEKCRCQRLYTPEDGWYEPVTELDFTAAAGLQAFIWSLPHITVNPKSWESIRSEEAEEDYLRGFGKEGKAGFQMPWDHNGQRYREFLYNAYKIPFIT